MEPTTQITAMLVDWSNGDQQALDALLPAVDAELRRLARYHLRALRPGEMFQTTSLINEAYIRLVEQNRVRWQNRAHFFAIASRMMRRVLLNHIRDQQRKKRGGRAIRISLSDVALVSAERSVELIDLDDALTRLAEAEPRKARVVEMRFFGGLTVEEVAEVMGIAKITVVRDWDYAKAWLAREIQGEHKSTNTH